MGDIMEEAYADPPAARCYAPSASLPACIKLQLTNARLVYIVCLSTASITKMQCTHKYREEKENGKKLDKAKNQ
jgi:hypothetical protein